MYQYTNNSFPTFKDGSLPPPPPPPQETFYSSPQLQPTFSWYAQQPMAAASAPVLLPANPPAVPPKSHHPTPRPKITTSLWEDEGTVCYQVDANGICVARRQDNDMINGTKLLNVTGMSRGKRDGILKNEKGRVVVKVGAMHLKGVWVTFSRAKALAIQHNIEAVLHPLFVDDPSIYFYSNPMATHANYYIPTNHFQVAYTASAPALTSTAEEVYAPHRHAQQQRQPTTNYPSTSSLSLASMEHLPAAPSVPSMEFSTQEFMAYREQQHQGFPSDQPQHQLTRTPPPSSSSLEHLDQPSLLDYTTHKGSSSLFSLPVTDSSPATPSQQSLFYDTTNTASFSPSPLSMYYSSQPSQRMVSPQKQRRPSLQQPQRHYPQTVQPQQQQPSASSSSLHLPVAPTLPSNTTLDSSFYYTHPCSSTLNLSGSEDGVAKTEPVPFDQATLDYYNTYTPHPTYTSAPTYSSHPTSQAW
ncbi:hypothetical protein DM01DRAFT_1313125 [Hesseltinella vesiculosa]|uniref:HTH APSES-type domain-containing protein n=1 Tax=Hesseltinella vesiculosa TaxID=101127 RepID=A0A1X2G2W1_9FUNG|nr:hypothetical protein DM01DRAFT_1313125 [Hesseltinella vesiculosa]